MIHVETFANYLYTFEVPVTEDIPPRTHAERCAKAFQSLGVPVDLVSARRVWTVRANSQGVFAPKDEVIAQFRLSDSFQWPLDVSGTDEEHKRYCAFHRWTTGSGRVWPEDLGLVPNDDCATYDSKTRGIPFLSMKKHIHPVVYIERSWRGYTCSVTRVDSIDPLEGIHCESDLSVALSDAYELTMPASMAEILCPVTAEEQEKIGGAEPDYTKVVAYWLIPQPYMTSSAHVSPAERPNDGLRMHTLFPVTRPVSGYELSEIVERPTELSTERETTATVAYVGACIEGRQRLLGDMAIAALHLVPVAARLLPRK